MRDGLQKVLKFGFLLPIIALLCFYSFVIYFRILLGYWPRYHFPDTGTFTGIMQSIDMMIFGLQAMTLVSPLLFVGVFMLQLFHTKNKYEVTKPVIIFAFTWLFWVGCVWLDPGRFFDWYFD